LNEEWKEERSGGSRRRWSPRLPFAGLLILCGTLAYRPALTRIFESDQLGYFAELQGQTTLASGLSLLDYGARRQYFKGDQVLYRPLLFAGLALENAAFRRDFRLWNAANLGVHLAVSYLLFEILWRTRRSVLACGFALWFALLMSNFELVTWSHLGGYMLGYGLLLLALHARGQMEMDQAGARWFWVYGFSMIGAMLAHEIAVIAGVGMAAHGFWTFGRRPDAGRRRWVASLLAPILVYAALYARHALRCDRFFWWSAPAGASVAAGLADLPSFLSGWAQHILLPRQDQLICSVGSRSAWADWPGGLPPATLLAGALWAGLLAVLWPGLRSQRNGSGWPFGRFVAFLVAAYAAMNLLGRPAYAMQVPYYDYFPALLGLAWLCSRVDVTLVGRKRMIGACAGLLLLAAVNGWQVRQIGNRLHAMHRPWAQYLGWVEATVRPRLSIPGYSFDVRGTPADMNLEGDLAIGFPDQNQVVIRNVLTILYGNFHNVAAPAEVLVFPGLDAGPR